VSSVWPICYTADALVTASNETMKKPQITLPKWLKIAIPTFLVLLFVTFFSIGWIFSGKVINVKLQQVEYDQTVQSVAGDEYALTGSAYDVNGIMGGIRRDGSMIGIYTAPFSQVTSPQTSIRKLLNGTDPKPAAGENISLQGNIWTTDPKQALGIDYQDVTYSGPLGDMTAWFVPVGGSTKWTIAVHGIGAHRQEMLRFIKPVLAAGDNMLIINYRNDANNPRSPDGYFHLGDTEWQDLEAAVRYAKSQGATDIRLYGVSLGGSIAENYLRRSADVTSANITKVILDSPALDWDEILRFQAKKAGYPSFVYYPAKVMANLRAGVNMERISTRPQDINHRTLLVHNADDPTVPQAASKRLADSRPDKVQFVDFGTGGHARAWNHDQVRYETLVTDFLTH